MRTSANACSKKTNDRMNRGLFPLLILGTALSVMLSLLVGAAEISVAESVRAMMTGDLAHPGCRILFFVRLPRAVAALLSGAALSVSGVVIQNVLHNPLAAPNIIGVNAGAGFSALLIIALFPAAVGLIPLAAFLGALMTSLLIFAAAAKTGAQRVTITLAGVAIGSVFTACSNALRTFFPDSVYNANSFFVGGFSGIAWRQLSPAWCVILLGLILSLIFSGDMDILSLGDETALSLGLPVRARRFLLLVTASLLAGGAVSFSGLLGFVGLIVPHILRRFTGQRHRLLVPLAAFGGGTFVLLCDTLSRTLFAPYEVPVGILLSLLGGPFFVFLLLSGKGGRDE